MSKKTKNRKTKFRGWDDASNEETGEESNNQSNNAVRVSNFGDLGKILVEKVVAVYSTIFVVS